MNFLKMIILKSQNASLYTNNPNYSICTRMIRFQPILSHPVMHTDWDWVGIKQAI